MEDTGSLSVLTPEFTLDFRNGVNADTVEVELLHKALNPVLEVLAHVRVVLIKIGEISKTAVLDVALVVPVSDLAITVVVLRSIQGIDLGEVLSNGSNVVTNDVNHHPNILGMGSLNQVVEIVLRAEVFVDLLPVACPVAMVTRVQVVNDWRDPDSIETHTLNVIKIVGDSLESTTTVVRQIVAGTTSSIILSETIGENLVD